MGKVPAKQLTEEEEKNAGVAHNSDGGTAEPSAAVGLNLREQERRTGEEVKNGMQR